MNVKKWKLSIWREAFRLAHLLSLSYRNRRVKFRTNVSDFFSFRFRFVLIARIQVEWRKNVISDDHLRGNYRCARETTCFAGLLRVARARRSSPADWVARAATAWRHDISSAEHLVCVHLITRRARTLFLSEHFFFFYFIIVCFISRQLITIILRTHTRAYTPQLLLRTRASTVCMYTCACAYFFFLYRRRRRDSGDVTKRYCVRAIDPTGNDSEEKSRAAERVVGSAELDLSRIASFRAKSV